MPNKEAILKVEGFNVEFWVEGVWYPAAIDMNFEVAAGEVLAIVGESGSGKSTTAMGLMGLLASNARTSGSVKVKGVEMLNQPLSLLRKFRGKEVAYIFQEPMTALNPVYTVGFQIVEVLRNHFEMGPNQAKERAIELLTMVEIPEPARSFDKYPHQLSGGQRQRAMIAQSLACDPALLIADEPTTALDVTVQADLLHLLSELRKEQGLAMLLVSHNLAVVSQIAERTVVMYSGEIVEEGPTSTLINSSKHPYTVNLIRSMPAMDQPRKVNLYTNEVRNASSEGCVYANRCPLVIPICNSQKPELQLIGETNVACHRHSEVKKLLEVPNDSITADS